MELYGFQAQFQFSCFDFKLSCNEWITEPRYYLSNKTSEPTYSPIPPILRLCYYFTSDTDKGTLIQLRISFSNTNFSSLIFKLHNIYSNLCLLVCVWSFLFDILKVELQEGKDSDLLLISAGLMSPTLHVYKAMKENFRISLSFSHFQNSAVINSENSIYACVVLNLFSFCFWEYTIITTFLFFCLPMAQISHHSTDIGAF